MSSYATYEEYQTLFFGKRIAEEEWPRISMRAQNFVDKITFQRIKKLDIIPEKVILAVCAVADVVAAEAAFLDNFHSRAGLTSFNNHGYSESYESSTASKESFESEKLKAADEFIPRSDPLRYAGVK